MVEYSGEVTDLKPEVPFNKKLEQKRSKLRIAAGILESIDDYVSAFDGNWNFIYTNKTTANDFGFEPERQCLGKKLGALNGKLSTQIRDLDSSLYFLQLKEYGVWDRYYRTQTPPTKT